MNDGKQNMETNKRSNAQRNQYDGNSKEAYKESHLEEQWENQPDEKTRRKSLEKPLKVFGILALATGILSLFFSGTSTVDTSEAAKNALKDRVSTAVSAGAILLSKDENAIAKDNTITHKSDAKETKIWVWDYAAEDGDYVQVLVNGAPVSDAFMIKHKPKEVIVPATGEVQIKGIRDGGGGITYAVRYDINGTSYFNGTPEGQYNTYTLVRE